ncbi:MAG: RNA polymerase subunit sigma-54 [Salinibacter sp.]
MTWTNLRHTARRSWVAWGTLACLLGLLGIPTPSHAQREVGSTTFGLQVGQPGGVTGKLYRPAPIAYDGLFTTDGNDFASLYVHRLWEQPLPDSLVHLYAGPGLLLEGRSLQSEPAPQFGLSAKAGLNVFIERFEVFLHVTPTARLTPIWEPEWGGSVGLRYNLR